MVVTTLSAGVCSLLKTLPPLVSAFILYIGVVFLITVLALALVASVIGGLTALIERLWLRFGKGPRSRDDDQP
jgi:hypothetical protein